MKWNTVRNVFFSLAFLCVATTSTVALSRDCNTPSSTTSMDNKIFTLDCLWIGASGSYGESEYPGQSQANVFPEIHLEHGPFYWINTTVGVVVASSYSTHAQLGIAASLSVPDSGFTSNNASELRGLDERVPTLDGGFSVFASGRLGQFELDMAAELEGEHDGLRASMRYNYPIQLGAHLIAPLVSLTVQDASRSNYYYGIERDDATGTNRNSYIIDQPTTEFSVGWSITRVLGRRFMYFHNFEARRVDRQINASPLTHRNINYFSNIGVMYRLY